MPDDGAPYCVEGCGRPAETSRPHAITRDGEPIVELVCRECDRSLSAAAEFTRYFFMRDMGAR